MGGRFHEMAGGIGNAIAGPFGRTLFPHFCLVCGKEGRLLCAVCKTEKYSPERGILFSLNNCHCERRSVGRTEARQSRSAAVEVRSAIRCLSAGRYSDPVLRELLHLYKYARVEEAGEALADFLAMKVGRHVTALLDGDVDPVVVPMPMNPINLALRGFNQAEMLADVVARELELDKMNGTVGRRFAWRPQAHLTDIKKRASNVSGAFTVKGNLNGRDVMLIDDVFTTGATVLECAKALAEAGAGRITVVTALKG